MKHEVFEGRSAQDGVDIIECVSQVEVVWGCDQVLVVTTAWYRHQCTTYPGHWTLECELR